MDNVHSDNITRAQKNYIGQLKRIPIKQQSKIKVGEIMNIEENQ